MQFTTEYVSVKQAIANCLIAQGWSGATDFDMAHTCLVVEKDYATAVGQKTATVSLEPRSDGFALVGHYLSQGRNILSTTWYTIPHGLSADEISAGASKFVTNVDTEVDQSYARRLR